MVHLGSRCDLSVTCPSVDVIKPTWIYNLIILISTLAFFLLPMVIISILYLLIGLGLRRERMATVADTSFGPESVSSSDKQKLSKRNLQVTKMLCGCHFSHVREQKTNFKLTVYLCVCVN